MVRIYIYIGLEYQEDLKIRAVNDATARKDQEHLEVRITADRNYKYSQINYLFIGNDQKKGSYALVSTSI